MVLGARGCPLFVSQTLPRFLFSPIFFQQSFGLGTNVNCQLSFKEHMCRKGWKIFTCLEIVSYRDKRGAVLQIDAMFFNGFPNAKSNSERMRKGALSLLCNRWVAFSRFNTPVPLPPQEDSVSLSLSFKNARPLILVSVLIRVDWSNPGWTCSLSINLPIYVAAYLPQV